MKSKRFILGFLAMLVMLMGTQSPLMAASKQGKNFHKESNNNQSSSSKKKKKKKKNCCKKARKLAKQINQTTQEDLAVDQQTLNVVNQINTTTQVDLGVDQQTLNVVNQINTTTQEDLAVDQQTLTVVNQINTTTQADLAVDQETLNVVNRIEAIVACSKPQPITQSMFTQTSGLVISKPGYYVFCEDILFSPATAINAITIESSDVVLDFKYHTLRQADGAQNDFAVEAVHVNRGLTNVTIVGDQYAMGQIRNFPYRGIRVEGNTNYVTISNMLVTNDVQITPIIDLSQDLRPQGSDGIVFQDYDPLATYAGATWSSTAGTTAAITAISGNGTSVTYSATNTFVAGQIVTISGAATTAYNIPNAVIASANSSQFTVTSSAIGASSAATATQTGPFMVTFNIPAQSVAPLSNTPYNLSGFSNTAAITNASGNGTTVTYTAANSFLSGQVISITGVTPSAYNLANVVVASASGTQFTVLNPATGAYVSGGTAAQTTSLNGAFLATASTLTSITFAFPNNPGTFGPGAGTITNLNTISNRPSTNVNISNVEVSNYGLTGVNFGRVTELDIDGLRCVNNWAVGCWFGNYPALSSSLEPYIKSTRVTNSQFDTNGPLVLGKLIGVPGSSFVLPPAFGAETNRCQNIEFTNCSFSSNFATLFNNSQTLVLSNLCKGLDDDASTEITFRGCSFDNNFSTVPGITVEGLHFSGSINNFLPNLNISLESCTFDGNYIQYDSTVTTPATLNGFALFYVKGVLVSGCSASGNYINRVTVNSGDVIQGYLNSGDRTVAIPGPSGTVSNLNNQDVVFKDCVALNNTTNSGSVFGFNNVATNSTIATRTNLLTGVVYRNCIAEGNQTFDFISSGIGLASPAGIGFQIKPGTSTTNRVDEKILLDGCIANRNGKVGSLTGQRSSGYYISGNTVGGPDRQITVQNCTSSSNDGYGFLFGNGEMTFVKFCEADSNTIGGFVDLLDDSASVLINNIAIQNGPNGAGPNYQGLSSTTPIALWKSSETSSPFTFNNQMAPAFGVQGSFVAAGTTLTVTSTSGIITPGMILTGGTVTYLGVPGPAPLSQGVGPKILAQLTGAPGDIGTYVVDRAQSAGATVTGLAIGGLDPELDNIDIQK